MNIFQNFIAVAGTLLICAARSPEGAASANVDVTGPRAVWQKHDYVFKFIGFTSTYSCDGLADKLEMLLKLSGARQDAKARSGACLSGAGRPDKFSQAHLVFYTLVPAQASADSVATAWQVVSLTEHRPRVDIGDCELVEQFQRMVLPMFTTRHLDSHTTCVPHQISGSAVAVRFESLVAAPETKTN